MDNDDLGKSRVQGCTKGSIMKKESNLCKLWISLFIHFNCVLATVKAEMPHVSLYKQKIHHSANIYSTVHFKIQCFTYHINWIQLKKTQIQKAQRENIYSAIRLKGLKRNVISYVLEQLGSRTG